MMQPGPPIKPPAAVAVADSSSGPSAVSPRAPTTAELVGRTAAALACATATALGSGIAATIVVYVWLASDGDTGHMEALGSAIFAALAFFVVATIVYVIAAIVALIRFIPSGYRLVPSFVLMSPLLLGPLAVVVGDATR